MAMYSVKSLLILDSEGKRVAAKYYSADFPSFKEQQKFEKQLFAKTQRTNGEIILLDNMLIVYRSSYDTVFYVIGSADENELLLLSVLNAIYETLSRLVTADNGPGQTIGQMDKRYLLLNLDYVYLTFDESIDRGIVLETDSGALESRVSLRSSDDLPISEQTISQALQSAREQIARSLLKGI